MFSLERFAFGEEVRVSGVEALQLELSEKTAAASQVGTTGRGLVVLVFGGC